MKNLGSKIIYELYPSSFYDSNNDGVGDIQGIIKKLDYLKLLGIDMIWINPIFKSPKKDNGYDICDYYQIDQSFGTMEDVDLLIKKAKEKNIDIMFDMVFNHVSTDHNWFKNALNNQKKYLDYFYIIKSEDKNNPPTNWLSKFGGSAWEYKEEFDGYYLHLFDKTQADINWNNENVRKEVFDVVNFWINKGVKGFRFDVVNLIGKPKEFIDSKDFGKSLYTDNDDVHYFLKELNKNTFGKDKGIVTVGEMSSTSIENSIKYTNPNENELDMVFNFHHLKVDYKNYNKWENKPWDYIEFKKILKEWQLRLNDVGWNAVFLNNHDQPRVNSRYGDTKKYWFESSTLFATLMFSLKGTVFLYQGEEIGMTNPEWDSIDFYRDVESINAYNQLLKENKSKEEIFDVLKVKSRDNSRTPMQWDKSSYAGFSRTKPWIDVNKNYLDVNVENQINDKNSVFNFYRNLINLRKNEICLHSGDISFEENINDNLFIINRNYKDQKIKCILNLTDKETTLDKLFNYSKILVNNYQDLSNVIKPFQAVIIKI